MPSHRILYLSLFCAVVALAPVPSQAAQPGPPVKAIMVAGNGQVVQTNFPAPVPLTIRVTDAAGIPVPGVSVGWSISCSHNDYGCDSPQNYGTLLQAVVQTDTNGIASAGYNQPYVPAGLSYTQATVKAATPVGDVPFKITATQFSTTSLSLDANILKPGTFGVLAGSMGSTLSAALKVAVSSPTGFGPSQGMLGIGVQIVDLGTLQPTPIASCNAPAGIVLSDLSGIASCDVVLGNAPGLHHLAAEIGDMLNLPFDVNIQSAALCSFSITPQSISVPAPGGSGSVSVTASDPSCTWTVTVDPSSSFITITQPPPSGVGNGTVNFTVGTNGGTMRTGTMTVAGQQFTVNQAGTGSTLAFSTASNLPGGSQGIPYTTSLTATGGSGTYTFALAAGSSLPPGLNLTNSGNTGVIAGTPSAAGSFPFTVTVSDTAGGSVSQAFTIAIGTPGGGLSILTTSLPNATVGTAYNAALSFSPPNSSASCGSPFATFVFSITSGSLPPGLSLQGNAIAGTPTSAGVYPFTLIVGNSFCQSPPASLTITVNGTPTSTLLNATPPSFSFTVPFNGVPPAAQQTVITSTGSSVNVAAAVNVNWLSVALNQPATPAILTVSLVNLQNLTPGVYQGIITITAPGNNSLAIPVTLTITGGGPPTIGLTVSSSTLSFTLPTNSRSQQVITVLGSATAPNVVFLGTAATSTGATWLGLIAVAGNPPSSAISATTPTTIAVTVSTANLPPGTYTGTVTLTPQGTNLSITIPVTMTVAQNTVTADMQSLAFMAAPGTSPPPPQTITLFSNSPLPVNVTTTTAAGGNWLFTSMEVGTSPGTISVSVNPVGLARGTYNGTVIITPADPSITPIKIAVTLTVGVGPGPAINGVVNAASNMPGPVSPGEFIAIYGANLSSSTPGLLTLTAGGLISTSLNNTQVLFDGIAAPLVFVSANQINAIVPYEIFGRTRTQLQVQFNGALSSPVDLAVAASEPGIFLCLTCQPANQAAALNQDSTPNSLANGAAPGSTVILFATGEGQTSPAGVTGSIVGSTLATPLLPVTVRIAGLPAQVTYAGSAPSLAEGVLQVNVVIPPSVPRGGSVPVTLTVGDAVSNSASIAIAP